MPSRRTRQWLVAALALAFPLACGSPDSARVVDAGSGPTEIAVARPTFTLRDTDGRPFRFAGQTAGRLTFLEFGYTNCPDVCPVHMANLAAVLTRLAPSDRMRIAVVFVSVDPDRDTPAVLRKWLDAFDATFIGLTGTREQLDSAQLAVGFAPAVVQAVPDGTPNVIHAASVLAFTADDTAHVMYPFGTRQADWEREVPRLLAQPGKPVNAPASVDAPHVAVERAYIVIPAGAAPAALYLEARNAAAEPDTLVGVIARGLGPASLHESAHDQATNTMTMRSVTGIAVPARGTLALAPGGFHGMLGPLAHAISRGDRIPLVVRFARAGAIAVEATVITYADVDTATSRRPR